MRGHKGSFAACVVAVVALFGLGACTAPTTLTTPAERTFDSYELSAEELARAKALDTEPEAQRALADGVITRDEYAGLMDAFVGCVNERLGSEVATVDPGGVWALPTASFVVDDDTWASAKFQTLLTNCNTQYLGQTAIIFKSAQESAATPPDFLGTVLSCLRQAELVDDSYTTENLSADLYYDDPSLSSWDPSVKPQDQATEFNVFEAGRTCLDEARSP